MGSARPDAVEAAIIRTVIYGAVFSFPLTVDELHHFLIHDEPVSRMRIETALQESEWLQERLLRHNGYIALVDSVSVLELRNQREAEARRLWSKAKQYGRWLARIPFVRMVGLTGALAVRNCPPQDDFDYLLVTSQNRVWLARAFAIVIVRLGRLVGVEICPNYVVAETALEQKRRDLYTAHEVTQIVPLYGVQCYVDLRGNNSWVDEFLPNATKAFYGDCYISPGDRWDMVKRGLEALLGGKFGDVLERWEYRRKLRRFSSAIHAPRSAAQVDTEQLKGHFADHGYRVLEAYETLLRCYVSEEDGDQNELTRT